MNIDFLKLGFETLNFYSSIKIWLVIFSTKGFRNMFLSIEEIERLTGCKRKSQQCAQLNKMHISYFKNVRCEPIVSTSALLGLKTESKNLGWQSNAKTS